jgi:uncharacterized coiled-coil protein SlyX
VGTAEHTDALTRRIEQLAAAALDEGDGAALAALIAALRSEIGAVRVDVGSLRSETGGLRSDLDGLEERVVASVDAGKRETSSLLRRFAGELDETLSGALGDAARATAASESTLEDARGVLESRLAVLEDALDGLSERLESLARDGATTTTARLAELDATVRGLDARLSEQGERTAEQVVRLVALAEEGLAATESRLVQALETARARAAEDRAAVDRLAATAGDGVQAVSAVLERTLTALQDTVGELATVVDERTLALRTDVTARMAELEGAMGAFRAEWPTRTFEVVEGARAVAEGITREVRTEVGAQLDRVRGELARGVQEVAHAREGLDAQSTRLADAGRVLVGYLEQRDRLLEAERDRVLHDVLDSFATGLSSRERTALASRMGDAVARRRDARDAERYRTSLTGSAPDRPGPGLPPELTLIETEDVVRALSGRGAAGEPAGSPASAGDSPVGPGDEPQPGPQQGPEPGALRSVHPPSTARGALAPPDLDLDLGPGTGRDAAPGRVSRLPVRRVAAPGSSVVPPPAGRAAAERTPAPTPARTPARTPAPRTRPASAPGRSPATPPEAERAATEQPVIAADPPEPYEHPSSGEDDGVRRLFQRRPRP